MFIFVECRNSTKLRRGYGFCSCRAPMDRSRGVRIQGDIEYTPLCIGAIGIIHSPIHGDPSTPHTAHHRDNTLPFNTSALLWSAPVDNCAPKRSVSARLRVSMYEYVRLVVGTCSPGIVPWNGRGRRLVYLTKGCYRGGDSQGLPVWIK